MSEEIEQQPLPQSREEDKSFPPEDTMADEGEAGEEGMAEDRSANGEGGGAGTSGDSSPAVRPIFFGNLMHGCMASDVEAIFERPVVDTRGGEEGEFMLCCGVVFGCGCPCAAAIECRCKLMIVLLF